MIHLCFSGPLTAVSRAVAVAVSHLKEAVHPGKFRDLLKQPLECADWYAYVFQVPSQPQVGQWQ